MPAQLGIWVMDRNWKKARILGVGRKIITGSILDILTVKCPQTKLSNR